MTSTNKIYQAVAEVVGVDAEELKNNTCGKSARHCVRYFLVKKTIFNRAEIARQIGVKPNAIKTSVLKWSELVQTDATIRATHNAVAQTLKGVIVTDFSEDKSRRFFTQKDLNEHLRAKFNIEIIT